MEKCVFAGLDNGGKTTIIYTLNKKFSLRSGVRPTIGINRKEATDIKLLGMKIAYWDLGGQEKFRQRYFKQKFNIFAKAELLFYVIDILDTERYDESLDYLEKILNSYSEELKEFPKVYVLFHKADPDKRHDPVLLENIHNLQDKIDAMSQKFHLDYFKTTIHDEKTVIHAFSAGVLFVSKKGQMINNLLREYAKATFSSAVLLVDDNGLMLGEHHNKKNRIYLEVCRTVAPRVTLTMERLREYRVTTENVALNVKFENNGMGEKDAEGIVFIRDFCIDETTVVYVISLARNERTMSLSWKYIPELASKLQNLMNSFTIEKT
mgnify:CR=1 FL=1